MWKDKNGKTPGLWKTVFKMQFCMVILLLGLLIIHRGLSEKVGQVENSLTHKLNQLRIEVTECLTRANCSATDSQR